MRRRHLLIALCLAAELVSQSAQAVWLAADVREDVADSDTLNKFRVRDFVIPVGESGTGQIFTIDFKATRGSDSATFVDILNHSIDVKKETVRRQIGSDLGAFSDVCDLDTMGVYMSISSIPIIEHTQADVTEPRRLSMLSVVNCVEKMPGSCTYSTLEDDGTGLDLSYMRNNVLKACHVDLQDAKAKNPDAFRAWQSGEAQKLVNVLFPKADPKSRPK